MNKLGFYGKMEERPTLSEIGEEKDQGDDNSKSQPINSQSSTIEWGFWGKVLSILMLALLVCAACMLHYDENNTQNVATHIGIMMLILLGTLTLWISARSKGSRRQRTVGDGGIRRQIPRVLLLGVGVFAAVWYMTFRHARPLSERYTVLVPSLILVAVQWLRMFNGRVGQDYNAKEIPLITVLLYLFGFLYIFSTFASRSVVNYVWLVIMALFAVLVLTLVAVHYTVRARQSRNDRRHSTKKPERTTGNRKRRLFEEYASMLVGDTDTHEDSWSMSGNDGVLNGSTHINSGTTSDSEVSSSVSTEDGVD
jgi:hypothetical protein